MNITHDRNTKFRADATKHIARATTKRRDLANQWLNLSITLDQRGDHIRADKAIFNALCIAGGSTSMKSLPISIGNAWL